MFNLIYDPKNPNIEKIRLIFNEGKWIYTPYLKVFILQEIPVYRVENSNLQKVLSFEIPFLNYELKKAFFYKIEDTVVGFINLCPHLNTPLDWDDDIFFNLHGNIVCKIHGAQFSHQDGRVLIGPARSSLYRVIVNELIEKKDNYLLLKGFYR